jgi:hypothetical protein
METSIAVRVLEFEQRLRDHFLGGILGQISVQNVLLIL